MLSARNCGFCELRPRRARLTRRSGPQLAGVGRKNGITGQINFSQTPKSGRRKICDSTQVFVHSHRRLRIFIAPNTASSCSLNAASLREALPLWRCHFEMKLREHGYDGFAIVVHNVTPRTKFAVACALSTIHHSLVGRLCASLTCTASASALCANWNR